MKLTSVQIQEYKSVRDSGPFAIGDVTCLVGKNESGKTALLEAINRLNPLISTKKFDVTEDYPRAIVEEYQLEVEQKKRQAAIVVRADFALENNEMEDAKSEFGPKVFKSPTVKLSNGYTNQVFFVIDIDESAATQKLVADAGLPPSLRGAAMKQGSFAALADFLSTTATEQENAFTEARKRADAIADAAEKAKALDTAKQLSKSEAAKQLRAKLAEYEKQNGLNLYIWNKYLSQHLPKFLYFDEYYQMEGQLNVQKLKERQSSKTLRDSDHPMLGLIELARLNLDQLISPANTQALLNKLEGASNYLTDKIFHYWSQNKYLSIRFDIRPALEGDPEGMREGTNLWGFVHDAAHRATLRLGTRSRGFIWFFSFLAWFSQQQKSGKPLILLLDEPGLFLHASAQADLLRYIEEELKPHHQVIYTTHSPFMVDPAHFERVRIVRDKSMEPRDEKKPLHPDEEGTKVTTDILQADEGSLFPLQGALAYDITQTLFVGPNTLIVEGVSDILFISTISGVLEQAGREGLSDKWTLSPVGGFDKVSSFVALFGSQKKLNVATLVDLQKKDEQKVENLYKEKLLKKNQVWTFANFTKTAEADIEDMFEPSFYLDLVNSEYKPELATAITESSLSARPRILVRLAEYFAATPLKRGTFNHYRPARFFAENIGSLAPKISAETLERFEEALKTLNKLLK